MKFIFAFAIGILFGMNCGCSSDEMGVDDDVAADAAEVDGSNPGDGSVDALPPDAAPGSPDSGDLGESDAGAPDGEEEEVDDGCGHRHQRGCGHVWEHDPDRRVPVCPSEGG